MSFFTSIAYLFAVLGCLYGPGLGDRWHGTTLFNAGIPLALVTAAQLACHERLCRTPAWSVVLGSSWVSGCVLICVPGAWPDDPLVQAVTVGGLLILAAIGLLVAAAIGPLRDAERHLAVRVLYGLAVLGVGVVFLRGGLRIIGSLDGGALAALPEGRALLRRVLSSFAALIAVAGLVDWAMVARRRTRA